MRRNGTDEMDLQSMEKTEISRKIDKFIEVT